MPLAFLPGRGDARVEASSNDLVRVDEPGTKALVSLASWVRGALRSLRQIFSTNAQEASPSPLLGAAYSAKKRRCARDNRAPERERPPVPRRNRRALVWRLGSALRA